ncbi:MAG: tetratricopeptide repeat protein [Acidobacteria bacterium]|uniref:Tetratricopeptide repeat protein n=1 Tax=Candidatus Polarisedimenticola svalbardensis TaxID=2886004 RepID=A0A8J6Y6Z6_9BACT|nr:tetratricopeptide repeat protein [Candidatus Polarisedimenticola svalbardensis]
MTLARLLLLLLAVLGTGCASSRIAGVAAPTTERWKEVVAGVPGVSVSPDYPLDVTPEMVQLAREAAGSGTPAQQLQALQDYLFDPDLFPFEYERGGTYTAIEAFDRKRGNCVAFTMLFIALGRSAGVNVQPALLNTVHEREREGELIVVNNHVVAVYKKAKGVLMYDFARSRESAPVGMRLLNDRWITAIYLNNLGVDDLLAGRLERARERLEMAAAMAGDFAMAFNNLGVVYRRLGDHGKALNAYVLALNGWGATPKSLNNMVLLYQMESGYGPDDALPLADEVGSGEPVPELMRLGSGWMARGRPQRAMEFYNRAIRLSRDAVGPMLARARAELYLRRTGAAVSSLGRALDLNPESEEVRHLIAFLKLQPRVRDRSGEIIMATE